MSDPVFFIGIGPTKTGSTWLFENLRKHPEVEMPFIKEIRYFDIKEVIKSGPGFGTKLKLKFLGGGKFRRRLKRRFRKHKRMYKRGKLDWQMIGWDLRYFFLPKTDTWYLSLFRDRLITGDITPNYAYLNEESIRSIYELMPHAKIMMGFRDPIERIWSHTKMTYMQDRGMSYDDFLKSEKVVSFLTRSRQQRILNNYVQVFKNWNSYFPEDQILYYFFDELSENPERLFERICTFLEVNNFTGDNIHKKANKGLEQQIPPEFLDLMISNNAPFIQEMADFFDSPYPQKWAKKYRIA